MSSLLINRQMAYTCFQCKRLIPGDINSLLSHLRTVHNVNSSTTYFQCCESSCNRTFSFNRSYRRHLHREHEENQALAQPANVLHQLANDFNVDEDDNNEQVEGVQAE